VPIRLFYRDVVGLSTAKTGESDATAQKNEAARVMLSIKLKPPWYLDEMNAVTFWACSKVTVNLTVIFVECYCISLYFVGQ